MTNSDCEKEIRVCVSPENHKSILYFQAHIKATEKKNGFNKSQTINRIISEWAEQKALKLEVVKK